MRFCMIEPAVMLTSASNPQIIPARDMPARPMPWYTTMINPTNPSIRPNIRDQERCRSMSTTVRIGCTPIRVAMTPGVTLICSASR